jgi:hypothetical protein
MDSEGTGPARNPRPLSFAVCRLSGMRAERHKTDFDGISDKI